MTLGSPLAAWGPSFALAFFSRGVSYAAYHILGDVLFQNVSGSFQPRLPRHLPLGTRLHSFEDSISKLEVSNRSEMHRESPLSEIANKRKKRIIKECERTRESFELTRGKKRQQVTNPKNSQKRKTGETCEGGKNRERVGKKRDLKALVPPLTMRNHKRLGARKQSL